ncbi:hypothetical protein FNF29_01199 [Cafeteria roenbergensis]|uniref:t-SNARE coiled-coil homology domain-containing protein n=1 Tax=Cafeteria roenbergensis TaxID=33653 RepID=A0A5A8CVE5_CAFRO|nr:hypothetical protein FNF29_01199 [Cafeteria roenbergensis]|eukprot:KAA0156407.1 hypothetical protein FNF29_01199 [Cafeteria roenbergensis]
MAAAPNFGRGRMHDDADSESGRLMSERGGDGVPVRGGDHAQQTLEQLRAERLAQDELLLQVERSASGIALKSDRIRASLREQTTQVEDLHEEMGSLNARIGAMNERINVFLRRRGDCSYCGIITCLSVVLVLLIIIVIWGA